MLNLKSGGKGGKHSQETKDKISKKNKGNKWTNAAKKRLSLIRKGETKPDGFGNKISAALKGRQQRGIGWHHSEKTKRKMSKAQKGKPKSKEHILNNARVRKKPIVQYSLTNKIITEWDSIADAGRGLNKNPSHIGNAIAGRINHAYGFIWKRK